MEFCELTISEYEAYVTVYCNRNFWQSNEMLRLEAEKGWKVYRVGMKENGHVIAAAGLISMPVFLSFTCFKILRGPMMDYDNKATVTKFLNYLTEFLKNHNCMFANTDPYVTYQYHDCEGNLIHPERSRHTIFEWFESCGWIHQGFHQPLSYGEPRWLSVLPLAGKSKEEILKQMNAKTRRNIHFVEKNCIKVRELEESEFDVLEYYVNQTGEKKHFYHPDLEYYQRLSRCFGENMKALYAYVDLNEYGKYLSSQYWKLREALRRENEILIEKPDSHKHIAKRNSYWSDMKVITGKMDKFDQLKQVYQDILPLAAALFIENNREIVYLFSGSDDSLRKWKGSYAIQWYIIQYALEKQLERYNFYGISGDFTESADDYGVFIFKKGFHADIIELPGDFLLITRKFWYWLYMSLKHVKKLIFG